jgi:Tfp pilus assembly protein PilN
MVEINLLPWREYVRKKQIKTASGIYATSIFFILVWMISWHLYYAHRNAILLEKIQEIKIQQLHTHIMPRKDTTEDNDLKRKIRDQRIIFEILNGLFHVASTGVYIKEISQHSGNIILIGRALSMNHVDDFMSVLLSVKRIHAVKLDSVRRDQAAILFQLRIMEWG